MTVAELIEGLRALPQDAQVYIDLADHGPDQGGSGCPADAVELDPGGTVTVRGEYWT